MKKTYNASLICNQFALIYNQFFGISGTAKLNEMKEETGEEKKKQSGNVDIGIGVDALRCYSTAPEHSKPFHTESDVSDLNYFFYNYLCSLN